MPGQPSVVVVGTSPAFFRIPVTQILSTHKLLTITYCIRVSRVIRLFLVLPVGVEASGVSYEGFEDYGYITCMREIIITVKNLMHLQNSAKHCNRFWCGTGQQCDFNKFNLK